MEFSPLWISLKTATCATAIAFLGGILLAWRALFLRHWLGLLDAILTLPMVLPPTVVGFFLLLLFGKKGWLGQILLSLQISFVFTWKAAVIAAALVSLPLMYRTARGAFEQVDTDLLAVARTLGATEWRIFWQILLPNAREGILAGLVLSFARALGEFGATIMVAGNIPGVTQTMSTAIYSAVQANDDGLALRWSLAVVAFSLCIVFLMNAWLGRGRGSRFL